jgi:hypothetical protein
VRPVDDAAKESLLPLCAQKFIEQCILRAEARVGQVPAEEVDIDTLTERLQLAAVEVRSQLELLPQVCAWTRVAPVNTRSRG